MHTFTDAAGRTWTVLLNLDAVKRVQHLLDGLNLLDLDRPSPPPVLDDAGKVLKPGGQVLLSRLDTDLILLCDVIFCLVKPQADTLMVTDEDFGRSLGGDAILAAHNALMAELSDFFRQLGRRHLATAVNKQTLLIEVAIARADLKLQAINPDQIANNLMDQAEATAKTDGNSSTNSPGSSDSTPAP